MVCHPQWPKYDVRNYPPLPAEIAICVALLVVGVFVLVLRIAVLIQRNNLLLRLREVPEDELSERLRVELVKAALEPGRRGDPPARI